MEQAGDPAKAKILNLSPTSRMIIHKRQMIPFNDIALDIELSDNEAEWDETNEEKKMRWRMI